MVMMTMFSICVTVVLNDENILKDPQWILKTKPFINQCNWKIINFSSHLKDWKRFETNNKTITLSVLYVPHNSEEIKHVYISKHNLTRKDQVIFLMMRDGKKGHYFAVKNLSVLFRGITSKQDGDYYFFSSFL